MIVMNVAQALKKVLEDKLREHNESNAVMELVLFQQAMEHITRIARIIDLPRGNAMLVGVGGSGKQSLARLASFICGYEVFQISVSSTYGVTEFKENLLSLYRKAGTKGTPITFLMTDNQIVKEVREREGKGRGASMSWGMYENGCWMALMHV